MQLSVNQSQMSKLNTSTLQQQENFFKQYEAILNNKAMFGPLFIYFNSIKQSIKRPNSRDNKQFLLLKKDLKLFTSQLAKQKQQLELYMQQCNQLESFNGIVQAYLDNWNCNKSFDKILDEYSENQTLDIADNNISIEQNENTNVDIQNIEEKTRYLQSCQVENVFQNTIKLIQDEIQQLIKEQQLSTSKEEYEIAQISNQEEIIKVENKVIELQEQLQSSIRVLIQQLNSSNQENTKDQKENENSQPNDTQQDTQQLQQDSLLDQILYVYKNIDMYNQLEEKSEKITNLYDFYNLKQEEVKQINETVKNLENEVNALNSQIQELQSKQPDQNLEPYTDKHSLNQEISQNKMQSNENLSLSKTELEHNELKIAINEGMDDSQLIRSKVKVSRMMIEQKNQIDKQQQSLDQINKQISLNDNKITEQIYQIEEIKQIIQKLEEKYDALQNNKNNAQQVDSYEKSTHDESEQNNQSENQISSKENASEHHISTNQELEKLNVEPEKPEEASQHENEEEQEEKSDKQADKADHNPQQ